MSKRFARGVLSAGLTLIAAAQVASAGTDFELRSGDKSFKSADARGRFVALHFLLKTECPYCLRHAQEYAAQAPSVAGVTHIFIKPDAEADIAAWQGKLNGPAAKLPIYHDADGKVAQQFGLAADFDFHGTKSNHPALILLGPDGKEVFRYVGKDNTDRLSFDKFAAEVTRLQGSVKEHNLAKGAVALKGYDPVSYHMGKPTTGRDELISKYRGVTYKFASEENREKFAVEPEKYAPAYGGWCATAMAGGDKVDIDPTDYQITNGRLFLFYKGFLGDAKKDWTKDEPNMTHKADDAWKKLSGETVPSKP